MAEISFERSTTAQTAAVSLAMLIALVLLGSVLAYWTWAWLAPSPTPRTQAVEAAPKIESAYGLFGAAPRNADTMARTGLAIKLLGTVAATRGRRGYAVLQVDAKESLAVREGEDVTPGVRLAEVHADRVVFERNGARETLAWPEANSTTRQKLPPPVNNYQARENAAPPLQSAPLQSPPEKPRSRREFD